MTIDQSLVGTPEPRHGPIARGCIFVGPDLRFPANFKEYATNVIAHKTKVAEDEVERQSLTSLLSGELARADDRLKVYPEVLQLLDAWKPRSHSIEGANPTPFGCPAARRFGAKSQAVQNQKSKALDVLADLWRGYETNVRHYQNANCFFLVPVTALAEVLSPEEAAKIAEQRELLLQEYPDIADGEERFITDEEAWAHDQWQRANKKGRWG